MDAEDGSEQPDRHAVRRDLRLAAFVLMVAAVLGVFAYRQGTPCWPWQAETEVAGGTYCDGVKARFGRD